ncbi:4-phosphoerythronate dehydrogenase [Candidatus Marithrix sp. Canyon 246]|uniref:4-phosphoerythronate dehydrogenase n=1 Tax=Candidatus Marithrix sp. Canyon 246 TaxID=1827136 RepID=UPI00084A27D0|nr:4-phosphoerythronate dehydrogenase [Candidatus Marithrix sp. Canyon 246]
MQIIADENIPYVHQAFAEFGEVRTIVGRNLTAADLNNAEILLVRSVTKINAQLLAASSIRFVGTATIGLDHIDLNYLQQQAIGFASAPGSNATSAAEYVVSALLIMAERQGFQLSDKTVGIIGCGNVGSRVLKKLTALGMTCFVYDPPLGKIDDLENVLAADIISLHVPLSKDGDHPTYQLVNEQFLASLRNDVILINTSRGDVVDENALLKRLTTCPNMQVILDVWQAEPNINQSLLQRAALATPHIAGYSFDGKVRATEMLYKAACNFFKKSPTWQADMPSPSRLYVSDIHTAVMESYDVRRDDAELRRRTSEFDKLRKNYPVRREFSCIEIELPAVSSQLATCFKELGYINTKLSL